MLNYTLRRLLLIIPTLFGIMTLNFFIVQAAPGGPVEQLIAQLKGQGGSGISNIGGASTGDTMKTHANTGDTYRGTQGLDPELIKDIEKLYGFDKPVSERFFKMIVQYAKFDFGDSFFRDRKVIDLVLEKMPVSISLGLWSTLLIYLISIPLGIKKAVCDGSKFDVTTSFAIVIGYAIPSFLFAIMLIILFSGGNYLDWFPLRGITSQNWEELSTFGKIKDYLWHITLPVTATVIGGFATLTMLTKNSFIEEISKQYVTTARAKGVTEKRILYKHVFRNAMLIVIAGFPSTLIKIFFSSSLLIEMIFSLDGLGLLSFEATVSRDYPVVFGTLYCFTLIGLLVSIISDLTYVLVDPRIDFEKR